MATSAPNSVRNWDNQSYFAKICLQEKCSNLTLQTLCLMLILTLSLPLIWDWSSYPTIPIWSTVSRYSFARNYRSSKLSLGRIQIVNCCHPRFPNDSPSHATPSTEPTILRSFHSIESNICEILCKPPNQHYDLGGQTLRFFPMKPPKILHPIYRSHQPKLDIINSDSRWHPNKEWLCVICLCVCIKHESWRWRTMLCMFMVSTTL